MQEINSIHSIPSSYVTKQGMGIVSLLVAFSIFCLKWSPCPWFISFAPLIGYVGVAYLDKKGAMASLFIVAGLMLYSLYADTERSFVFLYATIVGVAYLLTFLEKRRDQEEKKQYQEKVEAFDQEFTTIKKAYLAYQAQASSEKRVLEQQLNQQFLVLEEKKEKLNKLQKEYTALQGQFYADTKLESPAEDPQQLEEFRHRYAQLELKLQEQQESLAKVEQEAFSWEGKAHALEIEKLESLCNPPQEIVVLTKRMQHLSAECERQEQTIKSLEELISLLVPFARTQLYRS